MSKVRCVYEGDFFPPDDFEETALYGLVHARNLRTGTRRHTASGRLIHDPNEWQPSWTGPGTYEDQDPPNDWRPTWGAPDEDPHPESSDGTDAGE